VSEAPTAVATKVTRESSDKYALFLVVTGTFGLQGLTMVSGVIAARMLGVEARGQVALVFALGVVFSQLTFGGSLPNAIAKSLAERHLAARDGLRVLVRRWALAVVVPCALSGAALLYLQRHDVGDGTYGLAVATFVMTFQTIAFRLLVGCLQGEIGHLSRMAMVGVVPQALYTVSLSVALAAHWSWGAGHVLLAFFVSSTVGMLIGVRALAAPTGRVEDQLDAGALWATTRHSYVSSIGPIDGLGLDRLLVGALLGTAELGLYASATAVATLCTIVGQAVSVITLPRVAQHAHDLPGQRAVIRRWVSLSTLLAVLIVVGLELVMGPLIRIAFGHEFEGAITPARWLVAATGLLGVRRVLIAVLQGQSRAGTASWIELMLTPVMIVGTVVAAHYDSLSAIGMTMVAVAVVSCVMLGAAVRQPPGRRRRLTPR
jgi:O-antigen/teichoic acid export membrane protein